MQTSIEEAYAIMGSRIFGPYDAQTHLSFSGNLGRAAFAPIPWSPEVLLRCRNDDFVLGWDSGDPVLDVPMCEKFFLSGRKNRFFVEPPTCMKEAATPGWHLVRLSVLPASDSLPYEVQRSMLGPKEAVPKLPVLIRLAAGFALATGGAIRFFQQRMARTSTYSVIGERKIPLEIGDFSDKGFRVWSPHDCGPSIDAGIAVEILPERPEAVHQ